MTEQYIYSRSEREFVNSLHQTIPLGYGFMALSPGMDSALKRDVKIHCEDCPRLLQRDSRGVSLPLLRKTRLPKGQILLQKSVWIESGIRDFHVAHGYVLDDQAVKDAGPAKWLRAAFRLEDPNAALEAMPPLESRLELSEQPPFRWLGDTASSLGKEAFCQMLLACFDALVSQWQVLIAWDFTQPQEQELRRSILYWIYTCLPYDLWAVLGFDSVYTDRSSPGWVHLAFVDETLIRGEDQTPSIQLENQTLQLGGNFLVRNGEIIHNDGKYKTAWYGEDIIYAKWLRRLVDIVWDCPEKRRTAVVRALEDVRWSLHRQVPAEAKGKGLDPEDYRRACEPIYNLRNLEEAAGLEKRAPPAVKRSEPVKKSEPSPSEVYDRIFYRRMQSPTPEDLQDLAGIRGEMEPAAIGLLGAFMARESDAPEGEVRAVLDRCRELLPENTYAQLLRRLFWDELSEEERIIWKNCVAESGVEAAKRRRLKWYGEIVSAHDEGADLAVYIRSFLKKLPGISDNQRESMEDECLWWVFFERTLAHHAVPGAPEDIRLLASIRGGQIGLVAMGFLGAFMAEAGDVPGMKLVDVLGFYRGNLPLDVYSQLLCRLFWDELSKEERSAWNKCGVENSPDASRRRRMKWYLEIQPAYHPPEDAAAFAGRWLDLLPGICGQNRVDMEMELQTVVKKCAGHP